MTPRTPRPPRRPVVGSRNPTSRPRKVAGSREETPGESPGETPVEAAAPDVHELEPEPDATAEAPEPSRRRLPFEGPVTTAALMVLLAVVLAAIAYEAWFIWFKDEPVVSAERPVVTGQISSRAAVEVATKDVEEILSTSYKNYDAQVEQATGMMTDSFAEEYRTTVGDIEESFVEGETEIQVEVVGAGVVRASSEQVEALLFLNQYVSHAGKDTTFTPYRALVTMVHTDHGWLVSAIDTK